VVVRSAPKGWLPRSCPRICPPSTLTCRSAIAVVGSPPSEQAGGDADGAQVPVQRVWAPTDADTNLESRESQDGL